MNLGHNHAVDWWSFGVLLFEMLAGYHPFYDNNTYEVYRKITVGRYEFPHCIPFNARKLISQLLQPEPLRRLGCGPNGGDDIKNHIWFKGVEWDVVIKKDVPPPWVPEVEGD